MNVEFVRVRNFISHSDSTVEFGDGPLWLVYGDNGSGKSAFFDALEYALYGSHRGGTQFANLLVKHGESRGFVQVIVSLGGERYRITHDLDAERGNLGGRIERWQPESDEWRPLNPGAGRRAVWEWLRPHLPTIELFHSAVYLRQGQTAHFLRGTPLERSQRFGQLIALSRYADLARRASVRRSESDAVQMQAEADLRALGDISDTALARAEAFAASARTAAESASGRRKEAEATARGAEGWERLLARELALCNEAELLQGLLRDEPAIRSAADRVRGWDRASASLATYWREQDRAAEERMASKATADRENMLRRQLGELERRRDEAAARRQALADYHLPDARAEADRARSAIETLQLERHIAEENASLRTATTEITRFAGADDSLREWQALERAIPDLRGVVEARTERAQALEGLNVAIATEAEAQREANAASIALATSKSEESTAEEQLRSADDEVHTLKGEQARLEARIGHRGALRGNEDECPVCGQALDEAAHAHVRVQLAEEENALTSLGDELTSASAHLASSREALTLIRVQIEGQTEGESQARSLAAGSSERRSAAERQLQQAEKALVTARDVVATRHPLYFARIDDADETWIGEEAVRVEAGLQEAQTEVAALREAEMKARAAKAALARLRTQRRANVDPVGDERTPSDLDAEIAIAKVKSKDADDRVVRLENEEEQARSESELLVAECATKCAEAEAAAAERARAKREAEAAEKEASRLAMELGADWEPFLADRTRYDDERDEISNLRPKSEQLTALAEAKGKLDRVEKDLKGIVTDKDAVPIPHRQPVAETEACAESARAAEQQVNAERARAETDLDELINHRERATAYRQASEAAAERAQTYRELSDLLRDGGPIQNEVIRREQGAISDEVNGVLALLGDSLRVTLGDPMRRQQVEMHDLLVVDERDPIGQPRHFEFLSGGEQFRVALALALALHRRVGENEVGTIIVDEGFGALDADRRDSLAIQMTNISQGILSLGLAERIIISSHSAEVQRHFPDGWHIVKHDGTAAVYRSNEAPDALQQTG